MPLASFPSPSEGVWYLGPIPLRAYAFCIVLGVIAAVWISERRWRARGGVPGTITDLAVWAVPFGLVGGRLYHVITDWQLYFGAGAPNRPIDALFIWKGGLGIWGAIALGAVGVWIACRRRGLSLSAVADACAPGIAVAQAIGRWGNYFNQELFGSPTSLPWAVEIDPLRPGTIPGQVTYHPTFLYESLWDLALAAVLIWAGRRYGLRHGRLFALYVAGYTIGRFWIEGLRVDPAHHILGLRLNQWTSIVILIGALVYLWLTRNKTTEEIVVPGSATGEDVDPAHPALEADDHELAPATTLTTGSPEPAPSPLQEPAVGEGEASDPAHAADQADPGESVSSPVQVPVVGEGSDPVRAADQADPGEPVSSPVRDPAVGEGPGPVRGADQADAAGEAVAARGAASAASTASAASAVTAIGDPATAPPSVADSEAKSR